jgi:hypothetical protein
MLRSRSKSDETKISSKRSQSDVVHNITSKFPDMSINSHKCKTTSPITTPKTPTPNLVAAEDLVKVGSAKDLFKNPDDKPTGEAALREGYKKRIATLEAENEKYKAKKATLEAQVEILRKEREDIKVKLAEAEAELQNVAQSSTQEKPKVVLRIPGAPDISAAEMLKQRKITRVISNPELTDDVHEDPSPLHDAAASPSNKHARSMSARPSVMGALGKVRHHVGDDE